MKALFIISFIVINFFWVAKANDFTDLDSKITKTNQKLTTFCAKDGPIREYDGRFCETSSRVAAFIIVVCRPQFIPSHCHFKAHRKFANRHGLSMINSYDLYKSSQTTSEPLAIIEDRNETHPKIQQEINNLLDEAGEKTFQGGKKYAEPLCSLLAQSFQAQKKKWPKGFASYCTTWHTDFLKKTYPTVF